MWLLLQNSNCFTATVQSVIKTQPDLIICTFNNHILHKLSLFHFSSFLSFPLSKYRTQRIMILFVSKMGNFDSMHLHSKV